jgi:hypothetical protein
MALAFGTRLSCFASEARRRGKLPSRIPSPAPHPDLTELRPAISGIASLASSETTKIPIGDNGLQFGLPANAEEERRIYDEMDFQREKPGLHLGRPVGQVGGENAELVLELLVEDGLVLGRTDVVKVRMFPLCHCNEDRHCQS